MVINDDVIEKLESLSKLKLNDDEKEEMKVELTKIVAMFDKIAVINTNGIEPLRHMSELVNVMRQDIAIHTMTTEEALHNAPLEKSNFFAVPKVLD